LTSGPTQGSLAIDAAGNLYGTTPFSAFKLSPPSSGQTAWTETDIASLENYYIQVGLTFGGEGNLYGVYRYTSGGGGAGGIFELSPPPKGTRWGLTFPVKFSEGGGAQPIANLTSDSAGNLYGTTLNGAHGGAQCSSWLTTGH
jgi:hypothetical protein